MVEIRFHGRGGQGAKVASRIVGRAAFLAGLFAQDFPLFGAERRGAPVVACTRASSEGIDRRGYIEEPDVVVVMDDSLRREARAQVFGGVRDGTPVLVNTAARQIEGPEDGLPRATFTPVDLTGTARRLIGRSVVSAPAAAAAARAIPAVTGAILGEAVRVELAEVGLPREFIERNVAAASEVFAALAPLAVPQRAAAAPARAPEPFEMPAVGAALGAATIRHPGSSALRHTGAWRMERPEIDLGRCKRCFLCFLFCPEGAVALDGENYPHIDYEHCKGCMICEHECPPRAVAREAQG